MLGAVAEVTGKRLVFLLPYPLLLLDSSVQSWDCVLPSLRELWSVFFPVSCLQVFNNVTLLLFMTLTRIILQIASEYFLLCFSAKFNKEATFKKKNIT
jgi:hypothetical protein